MSIIDHGTWVAYKPEMAVEGAPENALFLRRESDGVDWYRYTRTGNNFRPDTVKLVLEQREGETVIRTTAVEVGRLFPIGGHVVEIDTLKRRQDEGALLDEFVNRIFDLKTAKVGALQVWKQQPDILARLSKLEEAMKGLSK
jgi:hypothetical protein